MAGYIISIVGGKGGVGKSVFAANFALAFHKEFGMRTLLVDQDLVACGDQNLILGMKNPRGLKEALNHVGNYDTSAMVKLVNQHPSGLHFLSAPADSSASNSIQEDMLAKFYKSVVQVYPIVVVDCGATMNAHTIKAMECSTGIFLITTPDILVVHQSRRLIKSIAENLFPKEMVQVVLNRFTSNTSVNASTVEKSIGHRVYAMIPEDSASNIAALSVGNPLLISAPRSPSTRAYHELVRKVQQSKLLHTLSGVKKISRPSVKRPIAQKEETSKAKKGSQPVDARSALKLRVHKELVVQVDLKKEGANINDEALRAKCQSSIVAILNKEDISSIGQGRDAKQSLVKEILDEALGLGPLEDLLADRTVSEIMVIARDRIYIEQAGRNILSPTTFSSDQQLINIIERIVMPLGRRIDEKSPYVDARLADGSRVHAIIPPLAIKGPTVTIRKFPDERMTWRDLVDKGSMTQEISDFLRICVEGRLNVVVSGGTGSGKTTLLNVLSNFIPSTERIITCEDAAELDLAQDHVVRLETRSKNIEGEGEVSIRDLVKQSLRMKPDRVIVGECRAGEALDMLQAMNTGHDGSLTTVHANNPRDSISRLETLVMMAGMDLPVKAIREQITSAVNLIVQQSRLSDGSRKITYITEVVGMQGDTVSLQDVFLFKQSGLDKRRKVIGEIVPTGFIPKFVETMESRGIKVPRSLFTQGATKINPRLNPMKPPAGIPPKRKVG